MSPVTAFGIFATARAGKRDSFSRLVFTMRAHERATRPDLGRKSGGSGRDLHLHAAGVPRARRPRRRSDTDLRTSVSFSVTRLLQIVTRYYAFVPLALSGDSTSLLLFVRRRAPRNCCCAPQAVFDKLISRFDLLGDRDPPIRL
jgi:hypothetical protein